MAGAWIMLVTCDTSELRHASRAHTPTVVSLPPEAEIVSAYKSRLSMRLVSCHFFSQVFSSGPE